jgi:hypothetical protein
VTGPGTFGWQGKFSNITCLLDRRPLDATYSFTVPTQAGVKHFTGTLSDARVFLLDRFKMIQYGAQFDGLGSFVPVNGSCFLAPVNDLAFVIVGSFNSLP